MVIQNLQCILLFKGTDFCKLQQLEKKTSIIFIPYCLKCKTSFDPVYASFPAPQCVEQHYIPGLISLPWLQKQLSPYGGDQKMPCLLVNNVFIIDNNVFLKIPFFSQSISIELISLKINQHKFIFLFLLYQREQK